MSHLQGLETEACDCLHSLGSLDAEVRPKVGAEITPNRIYKSYKKERLVEVKKIPKKWHFFGWFGTSTEKKNPLKINGRVDNILIGILDKDKRNIQLNIEGSGTILSPQSFICDHGDICYVSCVPNENHEFEGWKNDLGHIISKNLTYSFKATKDTTLTACFKPCTNYLKVKIVGDGIGNVIVNGKKFSISDAVLGFSLNFKYGTDINIEVQPFINSYFVNFIKGSNKFKLLGNDEVIIFVKKKNIFMEPVFSFIPQCIVESVVM